MSDAMRIDLSGSWQLKLEEAPRGQRPWKQDVQLPGSLQEQGIGRPVDTETAWVGEIIDDSWFHAERYAKFRQPGNMKVPFWLQPAVTFRGVAWLRKTIVIPESFAGKSVSLFMERPHWHTGVWLDGDWVGECDSLSVPHVYELGTGLEPGEHLLLLRLDNRLTIDVGPNAHSVSDHTQTNWIGVVGDIELRAADPVRLNDVQTQMDWKKRRLRVLVTLDHDGADQVTGTIISGITGVGQATSAVTVEPGGTAVQLEIDVPRDLARWDEFSPNLHTLRTTLQLTNKTDHVHDEINKRIGFREAGANENGLWLNGEKIFLRGTLDCAAFPLTGYPPTDEASWRKIMATVKAHGLNHIRFHSWCPPEAAFTVADEMGLYLQAEPGTWGNTTTQIGGGDAIDTWLYDEAERMIETYGHHPSFLLMASGNEPGGGPDEANPSHTPYLRDWVKYFKANDPDRLHTTGAGWPSLTEADFANDPWPRLQQWAEGLASPINSTSARTDREWSDRCATIPGPVVSHEIGQWCAYPDFDEIEKYTGFLKAKNFEVFKETLESNHLGDKAKTFLNNSGKLQTLCYKHEIESALLTPGFGGIQLLGLSDFPGQGTALVGMLDVFWEPKAYVNAETVRSFCSPTVILAAMPKLEYTEAETLTVDWMLAHYAPPTDQPDILQWTITDTSGLSVAEGELLITLNERGVLRAGQVNLPLTGWETPGCFTVTGRLQNNGTTNCWHIWVYPDKARAQPKNVAIHSILSESLFDDLYNGKTCLLNPPKSEATNGIEPGFSSIFWNCAWTSNQAPHTMGIDCDPTHPIFLEFPTENHSNWQWWALHHESWALCLDGMAPGIKPTIGWIDDWHRNRRLAGVFEAKVGNGRLLVTGFNLGAAEHSPAARSFEQGLLNYLEQDEPSELNKVTPETARKLLANNLSPH